jgi:excisionase family DNA binding protein
MHSDPTQPAMSPPGDPLRLALRPREAAKALGVSERALWTWTKHGDVPHLRRGRTVLYPINALHRWLAERAEGGRK